MSSTKDYYERLNIEKENFYNIIKDIANKRYGTIFTDNEIDDFFEIIELAKEEIRNES